MKIIVTGGAGFIGSHTVVELIKNGYEPVIIDDFRNAEPFILDQIGNITGKAIKHYAINCGDVKSMEEIFIINYYPFNWLLFRKFYWYGQCRCGTHGSCSCFLISFFY